MSSISFALFISSNSEFVAFNKLIFISETKKSLVLIKSAVKGGKVEPKDIIINESVEESNTEVENTEVNTEVEKTVETTEVTENTETEAKESTEA